MRYFSLYLLSFFASLLFFFSSCSHEDLIDDNLETLEQVVHFNLFADPPTLDPRKANDITSLSLDTHLFEGLTRISFDEEARLAHAKSYEVDDAKVRYLFYLHEAYWTNGDPVTAYDYEYSWKQRLDPLFPSDNAHHLFIIKNAYEAKVGELPTEAVTVKALDSSRLAIELSHPTPYFLELLSLPAFYPINSKLDKKDPNWVNYSDERFVSNGPFYLKEWKPQNCLTLLKNPTYRDRDSIHLDRIEMVTIPDETTELYMYSRGELDWAGSPLSHLPVEAIPSLQKLDEFSVKPVYGTYQYKINTRRLPFNNKKMRQAFSYAINRQEIVDNITQCSENAAWGPVPFIVHNQFPCHFPKGDREKALQLFEEALEELSLTRETLPLISISYNSADDHKKIAQVIQQCWTKTFDIPIGLEHCEWRSHLAKLHSRDFQIGRLGFLADFSDPLHFLKPYKYCNEHISSGYNDTGWQNEEFRELLNRAEREADPLKRKELTAEAEALFIEEMPVISIFHLHYSYVCKPHIKRMTILRSGMVTLRDAYLTSRNK